MSKEPEFFVIPADEKPQNPKWSERQIRVAAYCRVSTDDEEQRSSFEAQKEYYTTKIKENPHWAMVGVFADEGLSGTSAKKRPEFQKMLRKCKQGKIDLILTKSVSRFARNTLDYIGISRKLKAQGIAIYFEKENINTLEAESEMLLTIMGTFAQAESESISKNVAWGKRQSMKAGKVSFQYSKIYGYERGEDDQPKIIPEQAEIIRRIFNWYLSGTSVTNIIARLNEEHIPTPTGKNNWTDPAVRGILRNEKYCGDVLQQKTFVADVISKRVVKNTGQLPKYLIKNYHEPIVSHEIFYKTQVEITKRRNKINDSSTANIRFQKYSGKYGLSDVLLCGACGSAYKRVVWTRKSGKKIPVWRCMNRIKNGTKYCPQSPTIFEFEIQDVLLKGIATNFKPEDWQTADHMPMTLLKREWSQEDSKEIKALKSSLMNLLEVSDFDELMIAAEEEIRRLQDFDNCKSGKLDTTETELNPLQWDEILIRNLIGKIVVQGENALMVRFRNGKQVTLVLGGS